MERHSLSYGVEDLLDAERWANEGGMIAPEAVLRRERRMAVASQPTGARLLVVCEAGLAPAVLPPHVREAIERAQAVCVMGPPPPDQRLLDAVEDAVRRLRPDEIMVALREQDRRNWQARGLLDQVRERFGLPVTEVPLPASDDPPPAAA